MNENLNPSNSLKVSEMFYSLQGEGKTAGCPAIFVRLTACNLLCEGEWICDTISVWKKGTRMSFQEVVDYIPDFYELLESGVHLIFTGGEPLLQQKSIALFLEQMFYVKDKPHPFIEIETNGTVKPDSSLSGYVNLWNVSPKLKSSGAGKNRYNVEALRWFKYNPNPQEIQWKFVITNIDDDINEIQENFIELYDIKNQNVVLMPATSNDKMSTTLNLQVAEFCKRYKWWYGGRLQIQLWNQATGV